MTQMAHYILGILCASMLCAIIRPFLGKKGTVGAVGRLLCGVLLTMMILKPLTIISIDNLDEYLYSISYEAEEISEQGRTYSRQQLQLRIKESVEAYILDKAGHYGEGLLVEVKLTDDEVPLPCAVTINGGIPVKEKTILTAVIAEDLGIPEEAQVWIG